MRNYKRKNRQKIKIDSRLDLHGLTIEIAFAQTKSWIQKCRDNDLKIVEVVTGKSGSIRYEFPFWAENIGVKAIVSPHNGSFIVYLHEVKLVLKRIGI